MCKRTLLLFAFLRILLSQVLCKALDEKVVDLKKSLLKADVASLSQIHAEGDGAVHNDGDVSLAVMAAVRALPAVVAAADAFARSLSSVTDLCTRTSTKFVGDSKSQLLWFSVLDWIVAQQANAKLRADTNVTLPAAALKQAKAQPISASRASPSDIVTSAVLLAVFSETLQSVMELMCRSVPLNVVLQKVLSDHSQSPFGEFRGVILELLGSHAHESRILATAGSMMKADVYSSVRRLHLGFASAINARSTGSAGGDANSLESPAAGLGSRVACSACGGQLGPNSANGGSAPRSSTRLQSQSSGPDSAADGGGALQVFGCGHAYHQGCLPQAGGAALSIAGARVTCPQCAKSSERAARASTMAINGAKTASLEVKKLRPLQEAEEDSDDDSALERAVALGQRGLDSGIRTLGSGGGPTGSGPLSAPAAGATVDPAGPEADAGDPYVARLRKARAARGGSRPLAELYSDLGRPSGAMQVRRGGEQRRGKLPVLSSRNKRGLPFVVM